MWGSARRLADAAARVGRLGPALRVYEDAVALRWRASHLRKDRAPTGAKIPPARLRVRSGPRHLDPAFFLKSGSRHADLIRLTLAENGTSIETVGRLLDFGCGCGRVIRHWCRLQGVEIDGCDVNPDAVEWCAEQLPFAHYEVTGLTPPLPYPDGAFGLVYAFSVFTHLPRDAQLTWIRECTRVLRPGGYLFVSTLGEHFLDQGRLSQSERESFEGGDLVVLYEDVPGSNLCSAYHPQIYVEQVLAQSYEIVRFLRAADDGHHDLYLLRKPFVPLA